MLLVSSFHLRRQLYHYSLLKDQNSGTFSRECNLRWEVSKLPDHLMCRCSLYGCLPLGLQFSVRRRLWRSDNLKYCSEVTRKYLILDKFHRVSVIIVRYMFQMLNFNIWHFFSSFLIIPFREVTLIKNVIHTESQIVNKWGKKDINNMLFPCYKFSRERKSEGNVEELYARSLKR